jgi:hypothetical protein
MAEAKPAAKKPVEAATAAPGETRAVSRPSLAKASEAGDPVVHKLIGDLETARRNLDAAQREGIADPEAEASAEQVRAALAELGYE